jgi:RimJ/RimL family protein N-acetyltransferase
MAGSEPARVRLEPPVLDAVRHQARDTKATWERDYLGESLRDPEVRYFSILVEGQLVGEIFLHDIGAERPDSALVGYALFESRFRGRGFGSEALGLLVSEVARGSELNQLVVITAADNVPSRRIAEKNGFVESGVARENQPMNGIQIGSSYATSPSFGSSQMNHCGMTDGHLFRAT